FTHGEGERSAIRRFQRLLKETQRLCFSSGHSFTPFGKRTTAKGYNENGTWGEMT
ncbi:Uncharacterized protein DAT39_011806, partial [Clarias magur]